jgi:TM2 domain-containing membrane protein YozV
MTDQRDSIEEKYPLIAYLLWGLGFVGFCGLHRMYLGQYTLGTAMLFTFGLCGVGQLVDVAVIPQAVREANGKGAVPRNQEATQQRQDAEIRADTKKSDTPSLDVEEWDLEQASLEESLKKLKE